MRSLSLWFLLLAFTSPALAQKALLIEETPVNSKSDQQAVETRRNTSHFGEASPTFQSVFREGNYTSIEGMRRDRRVGVGVETFGRLGIVGLDVELNYGAMDSATVGFGGGPGYNSFSFGAKHVFGGGTVAPYGGLSLTRWGGTSHSKFDGTSPAYLEDKFLTATEKDTGQFERNFFVPALGLQFNQLQGPSAGGVLFAEVVMMVDIATMAHVPTGTLGAMYFF